MPQPTNRQVHVDFNLSNVSIATLQKMEYFAHSKMTPYCPESAFAMV